MIVFRRAVGFQKAGKWVAACRRRLFASHVRQTHRPTYETRGVNGPHHLGYASRDI